MVEIATRLLDCLADLAEILRQALEEESLEKEMVCTIDKVQAYRQLYSAFVATIDDCFSQLSVTSVLSLCIRFSGIGGLAKHGLRGSS